MISHYPSGAASPRPLIGLAVVLCLCLGQQGWTGQKQGPQPLAGVSIRNYADLTYTDSVTGVQLNVRSNTVIVQIQALEALSLVADNSIEAPVGTIACMPHCLTNTGNVTSNCLLSLENLPADDSDLGGLRLVHDVNGSGVADPGEPTILPTTPVQLEPEACLDLVVEGRVLGAAGAGCEARVKVTAKTVLQGLTVSNTDCVRAIGTVTWKVTKSASDLSPERGQLVTFTLRADLEGRVQPGPHSITVDGQTRSLVCFRDAIPVNTTFASLSDPGSGVPLYHLSGAPADTYVSAAPSDLSSIDAVGYGVESVVPGNGFGFGFAVRISDIASGTIPNIAWVQYTDPVTDRPGEAPSNRVELVLPTLPPQVAFYVDGTFARITCVGAVGTPLYVQALIAYDNKEPAVVETVTIRLSSALTGDVETFAAVETGPNTGIFRIVPPVPTRRAEQGSSGDGVIDSITNDTITARATGSDGQTAQACLQMDPTNVVFDSHTNQPITGARVTLIDVTGEGNGGKPGEPAVVYLADGVTTAPCAIETGSNGCFAFCMVKASTYQFVVAPPGNYHFPTALAPTELPSDRLIGADASYGRNFTITGAVGFVRFDIPLDAPPPTGLFVQKQASRSVVTIGDFVDYRLQVRNASNVLLQAVSLSDRLPAGFSYVAGTARLDGEAIADPAGGAGPALTFELGELEPETEVRLTYRVRVGPGAVLGDATNRARAEAESAWGPVLSNFASATVRLEAGVFSDRSVVVGRIFVDGNENGLHDHGEPGVPGVRIYLEDGTYAVTDSEGKYSLYGLRSGSRVLKVDPVTLPPGANLSPITRRHLDDGGSVLADLKNGQLQKINFALVKPTAAVRAEVERRRSLGEVVVPEVNRAVQETVSPDGLPPELSDVRGRPANGMIGADAGSSDRIYRSTLPPESELADPSLPDQPVRAAATAPLEALLPTLDNTLGFVGLKDQDTMPMAQVNVQAKGRMGSSLTLKLNGAEVPAHRVGSRASVPEKQLQVVQYIGLELRPGANQLELLESDSFGNARGKAEITIVAPGRPGKLNVEMPTQGQPADGKTAVPIRISIADQQGTVVSARTPVTLEASLGRWDEDDLDPNEPGVQVFVEGGSREVQLLAPAEPGAARVIVSSGLLKSESVVRFLPDLRPLLGLGVLEAKLNFRSGAVGDGLVQPFDPFENELRSLTHVSSDGDWRLSGRAALFLKGRVGEDYLVTMGYDSEQEADQRLFRDIQPDEFYPVYGDSSLRGFDAQSTSRLYARMDHGPSYLMYGDYSTRLDGEYAELGSYYRSLTGVASHIENQSSIFDVFASRDSTEQVVDEFRASGTSGPFTLTVLPFVENSEQVEIITRDRQQPAVILKRDPLLRFADYEIDPLTGRIILRTPVPSVDSNFNPVYLRVTYEAEGNGPRFWLFGATGRVKLNDRVELSGTLVDDQNPDDAFDLRSASVAFRPSRYDTVIAEWAQTRSDSLGRGDGGRLEYLHNSPRLNLRLYSARTDEAFDNPSASLSRGRQEFCVKATQTLGSDRRLLGEITRTEDVASDTELNGYMLSLEQRLRSNMLLELGMRHAKGSLSATVPGESDDEEIDFTTVRGRLSAQLGPRRQTSLYGEYEQDVHDSSRRVLALGGEQQIANRTRLYARHELISSIDGRYALDSTHRQQTTLFGLESDYMRDGHLFSEYRVRDAFSGRDTEAAIGLRNRWHLSEGLAVDTSFERITPLRGMEDDNRSRAITMAVEYTRNPLWVGTARAEWRDGATSDSTLLTLGLARKLDEDWALLGRYVRTNASYDGGGEHTQDRLRLGAAYRDLDRDRWNGLVRYELLRDDDTSVPDCQVRRHTNILSMDLNYQSDRQTIWTGHYAWKQVDDRSDGLNTSHNASLLSGRVTRDLGRRFDLGVIGSRFADASGRLWAVGTELGYMLKRNLWLAAGYNWSGFHDDDLVGENYTADGPYLRIRFKFDETAFPARFRQRSDDGEQAKAGGAPAARAALP